MRVLQKVDMVFTSFDLVCVECVKPILRYLGPEYITASLAIPAIKCNEDGSHTLMPINAAGEQNVTSFLIRTPEDGKGPTKAPDTIESLKENVERLIRQVRRDTILGPKETPPKGGG
jgi:hypothetical protein